MATGSEKDIVVAKVTSMVVLGGAAFIVTLLPVFINRRISPNKSTEEHTRNARSDYVLSLFLSFGGGVLLCTTFLHLLPEVTETIENLKSQGRIPDDFPLPLPELIMCLGFFIMYIVEEVVHKYLHSRQLKKALQGRDNPLHISSAVLVDSDITLTDSYKEMLKQDAFRVAFSPPHDEDLRIISAKAKSYGSSCSHSVEEEVNHNHSRYNDPEPDAHCHHDHEHHEGQGHHDHHVVVTADAPSLRELLIVLALTIHEGFEGMAIGLEESVGAVWYLLAAVAVHKCVIAFCIGVELVSGHISLALSVFYAFIYSCASPFGIGIGLLLTSSSNDHLMALLSVILQGMATGTLLYVVFFEILRRDGQSSGGSGLSQMFVVILGFVAMAAVTVLIDA